MDNYFQNSVVGRQRDAFENDSEYQETNFKSYVGISCKAQEEGHNFENDALVQKVCMHFLLNIFKRKRIHHFWPRKQVGSANLHYTEVSIPTDQKGHLQNV